VTPNNQKGPADEISSSKPFERKLPSFGRRTRRADGPVCVHGRPVRAGSANHSDWLWHAQNADRMIWVEVFDGAFEFDLMTWPKDFQWEPTAETFYEP
jgi:hypothetical protein